MSRLTFNYFIKDNSEIIFIMLAIILFLAIVIFISHIFENKLLDADYNFSEYSNHELLRLEVKIWSARKSFSTYLLERAVGCESFRQDKRALRLLEQIEIEKKRRVRIGWEQFNDCNFDKALTEHKYEDE
ncbi:MAG: hypothetical protein SPK26_00740 [Treponema sp.]|nr:hypothetical protein [Treponema sp.]